MNRSEAIEMLEERKLEPVYKAKKHIEYVEKLNTALDMAIEALKREPQKKYPTEWCEQCTLWEDNKCIGVAECEHNIEALKYVTSEDLISRAEAIEVCTATLYAVKDPHVKEGVSLLWQQIKDLPSVSRPKGEWTYHRNELSCVRWSKWECSACHERQEYKSNFCPNCGADMRGEDE